MYVCVSTEASMVFVHICVYNFFSLMCTNLADQQRLPLLIAILLACGLFDFSRHFSLFLGMKLRTLGSSNSVTFGTAKLRLTSTNKMALTAI